MWKLNSATILKSAYALFTALFILFFERCTPAFGQQHIIANKDLTRPEINTHTDKPAFINSMTVQRWNGYNEIGWTALREDNIRKYVVEYSLNAIDFQSAGEVLTGEGMYSFKHYMIDGDMFRDQPILYRIRMEQLNSRTFYSGNAFLDGEANLPVRIFPTIIEGNTVHINSRWPIERITVTAGNGNQVLAKEINGQKDYMSVVIPPLSKGMYWMTFYGNGWKTTSKFIVP